MRIVISSGHGKKIRGAEGPEPWGLDEVDEARHVVEVVADLLQEHGTEVITYHDDISTTQDENLERIVDFHNAQTRDLDVSIHFNAFEPTPNPMGCEVWYVSQEELARSLASAMAEAANLPDRGPKRNGLYFLNNTEEPAVLLEVCFVDSETDAHHYRDKFHDICGAIADTLAGDEDEGDEDTDRPPRPERPEPEPPSDVLFYAKGRCSWFGGPTDDGVSADEDLAFIFEIEDAPYLFLPYQPEDTSGLARRLNPYVHFVACRWDYDVTSKTMLRESGQVALVRNTKTGYALTGIPADWGPHEQDTGRAADLSLSLLKDLGLETDDEVEVIYPWHE